MEDDESQQRFDGQENLGEVMVSSIGTETVGQGHGYEGAEGHEGPARKERF